MSFNFRQYNNVTNIVIPNNVNLFNGNLSNCFQNMKYLKSVDIKNINNITNMALTYFYCFNLIDSPICGNNVKNMSQTYCYCQNLTGSPVCGDSVTNMRATYEHCHNLTGSPVCGDKVTDMAWAYSQCFNLTGSPVCGDKVTDMRHSYSNCQSLTGFPVCGNNVEDMGFTYEHCRNLTGEFYINSNNVNNFQACFFNFSNDKRLNIYVYPNTTSYNTLINTQLKGYKITYTQGDNYLYNTAQNIYIYFRS